MSSIKVGDQLTAMGPSDATAKTVQAYRIADGATPQFGSPRGGGGANPFAAYMTTGKVVSTSPLKLKDAQGRCLHDHPGRSYLQRQLHGETGTLKSVVVGKYVTIRPSSAGGADVSPTATAITADTVVISSNRSSWAAAAAAAALDAQAALAAAGSAVRPPEPTKQAARLFEQKSPGRTTKILPGLFPWGRGNYSLVLAHVRSGTRR